MFVVIYRWKVQPGKEEKFRRGWRLVTESIRQQRGSLGGRLHKCHDGSWLSYAQWSSKKQWESAWRSGAVDEPLGYKLLKESLVTGQSSGRVVTQMTLTDDLFE